MSHAPHEAYPAFADGVTHDQAGARLAVVVLPGKRSSGESLAESFADVRGGQIRKLLKGDLAMELRSRVLPDRSRGVGSPPASERRGSGRSMA
jgi:hypothetical protein